jgi:hypothetical protein
MSPEEVRAINYNQTRSGSLLIILIGVLSIFIIIAFISSFILGSLNSARTAGNDAMTKQSLVNLRAMAEIYSSTKNGSYAGFCSDPFTKSISSRSSIEKFGCTDSVTTYVASAMLNDGKVFCVDSSGVATTTDSILPGQPLCDPKAIIPVSTASTTTPTAPTISVQSAPTSTSITSNNQQMLKFSITPPVDWKVDKSGLYGTMEIITDPTSNNQANIYVIGTASGPSITLETAAAQAKKNLVYNYKDYEVTSDKSETVNGVPARLIAGTYTHDNVPTQILQLIIVTKDVVYTTSAIAPASIWTTHEAAIKSSLLSATLK